MTSPSPTGTRRRVVVGLFEHESQARYAVQTLSDSGISHDRVSVLTLGLRPSEVLTGMLPRGLAASDGGDLSEALASLGVPDGEARFYASEASDGRTLLVIDANGQFDAFRAVILEHGGYDVRASPIAGTLLRAWRTWANS